MLKIRRPLGRLIFNMGIAIPGKTVFLIETAPRLWSNIQFNKYKYTSKYIHIAQKHAYQINRSTDIHVYASAWYYAYAYLINVSTDTYTYVDTYIPYSHHNTYVCVGLWGVCYDDLGENRSRCKWHLTIYTSHINISGDMHTLFMYTRVRRRRRATPYFFRHHAISYGWHSNSSVGDSNYCYVIRRTYSLIRMT